MCLILLVNCVLGFMRDFLNKNLSLLCVYIHIIYRIGNIFFFFKLR